MKICGFSMVFKCPEALAAFKSGANPILVATDVAARGSRTQLSQFAVQSLHKIWCRKLKYNHSKNQCSWPAMSAGPIKKSSGMKWNGVWITL